MKLVKEIRDNAAVLTIRGDFDSFVCGPFMEEMNALLKSSIRYLILDMRLILFINSTAVGTLIKVNKEAKKQGGKLVICRPSKFVHNVLESLGLGSVFSFADDPDKALEELGASKDGMDMSGENNVILRMPGQDKDTAVGKIASMDEKGMVIVLDAENKNITQGVTCDVKFRLPLFRKGHYFEAGVSVDHTELTDKGFKIKSAFQKISDENKDAIAQFVEEIRFLRSEAHKD